MPSLSALSVFPRHPRCLIPARSLLQFLSSRCQVSRSRLATRARPLSSTSSSTFPTSLQASCNIPRQDSRSASAGSHSSRAVSRSQRVQCSTLPTTILTADARPALARSQPASRRGLQLRSTVTRPLTCARGLRARPNVKNPTDLSHPLRSNAFSSIPRRARFALRQNPRSRSSMCVSRAALILCRRYCAAIP
ncbi:hypothetical protein EXIGLDRAFT_229038 [Exidia glandulosa HHB12029]|uniref:Uncharacterized protein n=1 Tax=Exidia glandulosa HHB12029 TaxID=1314781 RepID=A0A165E7U6_EXIGL|nr:hypothetical protein EXIGLDRAFT_229038 [Exidia glandulosa HHB12029]